MKTKHYSLAQGASGIVTENLAVGIFHYFGPHIICQYIKLCKTKGSVSLCSKSCTISGNRLLHNLTSARNYSLRVELDDFEGETRYQCEWLPWGCRLVARGECLQ